MQASSVYLCGKNLPKSARFVPWLQMFDRPDRMHFGSPTCAAVLIVSYIYVYIRKVHQQRRCQEVFGFKAVDRIWAARQPMTSALSLLLLPTYYPLCTVCFLLNDQESLSTPNLPPMRDLRIYPLRFCAQLYRAFYETEAQHNRTDLRHKNYVPSTKSDRELFEEMPLGDIWSDANLARTYFYARDNKRLIIPESWLPTIENFDEELRARAPCQDFK